MESLQVDLYPWDAGTEEGSEFSLSNSPTSPQGVIANLRGTGKFSNARIATLTFTLQSVNIPPTGAPFVTGAAEVGDVLTADTSAINDADGLTTPGYAYQWVRVASGGAETDIPGARASTYTVQGGDVNSQLKVRVSFTDDGNNTETLASNAHACGDHRPGHDQVRRGPLCRAGGRRRGHGDGCPGQGPASQADDSADECAGRERGSSATTRRRRRLSSTPMRRPRSSP